MPRYLIYAQDQFGTPASKTGNSVIRYSAAHVAAVLDASRAGRTSQDVLGYGGSIPVVGSVDEGIRLGADSLLVGIALASGGLPTDLRDVIRRSLELGLDVWNGLHGFVSDDPELAQIALRTGATIHDVRRPPADLP